jgi:ABC-type glycerol-3-phosphate transport system substrate-binding protein
MTAALSKIFGLALTALLLQGCTTASASDPPPELPLPARNPKIGNDPITLEVWLDLDFTRNNSLFDEVVSDFESVYPNIEVETYSFIRQSMPQKVKLAVDSGIPPDVVQGHVHAMAGQGLATPLTPQWKLWAKAEPHATEQFLPSALNEATWQGQPYGIPLDVYTLVLLYNREHFDQAGLPYPESNYNLSDLAQSAQKLTDPAQKRYGMGFTTDPWYVYAWITGAGGDVISGNSDEGFSLTLDSKTNVDALDFLMNMVKQGYGPRPSTRPRDYEEVRQRFLDGEIAMYFGESQDIHIIQSTNPDFPLGVAQLPTTPAMDSAASVLGSSGLFIPKGALHKDAAFEFMKWMANDRYAVTMARRTGRYPAKIWLPTSPEFAENLSLLPFFNQLNAARPYRLDLFPKAEDAFTNAIKSSFYNIATPAEALQQAQKFSVEQ